MKKKFVIINVFLMIVVLSSMLFQSLHSYEHLAKQISEKKCLHQHHSKAEITHQHHGFDNCFVCEFTFASYIPHQNLNFIIQKPNFEYAFSFLNSTSTVFFFKGSLFALRAPPKI